MSPSAVPLADRLAKTSVTVVAVAAAASGRGRCSPRFAPSAAKTARCLLSPATADRYTVAIATENNRF